MKHTLKHAQERVEAQLKEALVRADIGDEHLAKVLEYGLLNGGKRIRPFLVYAAVETLGGKWECADAAAVAIEMVHSYSLIHDDLPAMDNDDLRRGKPTCHIAFDEASAILAGDALLTLAFEVLAGANHLAPAQIVTLVTQLSKASGPSGMVAGQHIDLQHVGQVMTLDELENMHRHKTGALIEASVLMGATCAKAEPSTQEMQALSTYARAIGLAFQVHDDVLDIEGDASLLGKNSGADIALDKPTYPALLGLDGAKSKAQALINEAQAALNVLPGSTDILHQLADYVIERRH